MYPYTRPFAQPIDDHVGRFRLLHPKCHDVPFLQIACRRLVETNSPDLVIPQIILREMCAVITGIDMVAHTEEAFFSTSPLPDSHEYRIPIDQATLPTGDMYLHLTSHPDYQVMLNVNGWTPLERSRLGARWFTEAHPQATTVPGLPIVPVGWNAASQGAISAKAKELVGSRCVVTGWQGSNKTLKGAHVVPKPYLDWYSNRQLWRQLHRIGDIPRSLPNMLADIRNILPISVVLHRCWDDGQFALIPVESTPGTWITCFIGDTPDGLAFHHHWRQVAIPSHIDPYFLYLRFALTTFEFTFPRFHQATHNAYNLADPTVVHGPDVPDPSPFNSHSTQGDPSSDAMENDSDDWPAERDAIRKAYEEAGLLIPDSVAGLFVDPAEDEKMNRLKREYMNTHPNVSGSRTTNQALGR